MTQKTSTKPAKAASSPKRKYEPPAVEESSEFETLALSCAKQPFTSCAYYGETANS